MYKRISDILYGSIMIEDEFIYALICTKEFERLSRISQLGLVHLVYPSANHSRKSHSLGVYELARKALTFLKPKNLPEITRKAILASALLHDLGHGPMSHLFECVSTFSHESYTLEIISNPQSEVNQILQKEDKKLIKEVIKIIKGEHPLMWINSLISSQIDVDRLDYVLRDTKLTATNYGSVPIDYIFSNLTITNKRLVFKTKCYQALENFLVGRQHMYQTVYLHPKNLNFQFLYTIFFKRIKHLLNKNYQFNFDTKLFEKIFCKKMLELDEFYKLDDYYLWTIFEAANKGEDPILKKITYYLLHGTPSKIFNLLKKENRKKVCDERKTPFKCQNYVIDIGKKAYGAKEKHKTLILDNEQNVVTLYEFSPVVKVLTDNFKKTEGEKFIFEL